jgi:aminopeptidase N
VPSGFTAVTGGTLIDTETTGARITFHYQTEARLPRALPFGFAVGKYVSAAAVSKSGLRLTVYGYPGEEKLIEQRLQVALESAHIFEQMMGSLPWKDVRFAHVTPERKETGVSLPGLILISDGFFEDFSEADLSDGQLNRPDVLSLLVVADELSHQWNFYAAGWPNELAEGVSTFTNCLLVERRHGREAYRKAMKFCRDAYIALSKLGRDVAVADPKVYRSDAYRGIAFCKVPAILDMLRTELGDEAFFAGWRRAFSQFDPDRDGYDVLQRAFSEVAERDFKVFFDQWFFVGGLPRITLDHGVTDGQLTITIHQVQPGPLYRLDTQVLIRGRADEVIRKNVMLEGAETVVRVNCDFEVVDVVFDPDDLLLKEMASAPPPPGE